MDKCECTLKSKQPRLTSVSISSEEHWLTMLYIRNANEYQHFENIKYNKVIFTISMHVSMKSIYSFQHFTIECAI